MGIAIRYLRVYGPAVHQKNPGSKRKVKVKVKVYSFNKCRVGGGVCTLGGAWLYGFLRFALLARSWFYEVVALFVLSGELGHQVRSSKSSITLPKAKSKIKQRNPHNGPETQSSAGARALAILLPFCTARPRFFSSSFTVAP